MDVSSTIAKCEHDLIVKHDSEHRNFNFNGTNETVTYLYASGHPNITCPKDAMKILFEKPAHHLRSKVKREFLKHEVTQEEMDMAAKYGRFPQRPSNLFLKLFCGALNSLEHDPLSGCVSPQLIGASGVIPLTIISTIPDIMCYYHHAIVHAQKEVLFATCWWEKGETANIMSNALRDLSKRAAQDKRHVIVKIMIDHLTKANLAHSHAILPSNKLAHCNIPTLEELPFISLEVNTYHRMIMGASHSKFLIVDRKIALLNSNNIYDRPNLEMMVHYEGDIVNSFYDTFLISWEISLQPDLVCLREEAPIYQDFHFGTNNTTFSSVKESLQQPVAHSSAILVKTTAEIVAGVIGNDASPRSQNPLTSNLNKFSKPALTTKIAQNLSSEELENLSAEFIPFIFHTPHQPFPIALVNRAAHGNPSHTDKINPQNAAWLSAFRYAQKSIFIQSPNFNASLAIDGTIAACRRGIKVTLWLDLGYNYLKEGRGTFQGGTNEHVVKKLYKELKDSGDGAEKNLETFWYVAKDQTRPLHFSQKQRNCHVKFMSIDDQVAIIGSGNMDTQSWFHSQEMNTMIDSSLIVKELIDGLYKNQSTNQYGKLDDYDGKWHDSDK